ncbi:MAG: hypothetical protein ACYCWW_00070 [Deltaproteobacteria bacterium]
MRERLHRLLATYPILRRLPLLAMIAVAAYLIAEAHREPVTLRYELGPAGATGLRADIYRGSELAQHAEWHFSSPSERHTQVQRVELAEGDYEVAVSALGSHGPDPRPLHFHVDHDGPGEIVVEWP